MRTSRRAAAACVLSLALLMTTACGGDEERPPPDDPTSASSSEPPESTGTGTPAPSSAPAPGTGGAEGEQLPPDASFPADASADGGPALSGGTTGAAAQMHVTGLRLASHEEFDRLVIDLSTTGVPEWTARYTEASGPGGGPVDIAGDSFLRVVLSTQAEMGVQSSADVSSSGLIAQSRTTGFFEGHEEVLVGIRGGELPFRAFALTDPGRIVIDVRR